MRYEVCLIDDHILPYGNFENTGKISQGDFEDFLEQGQVWSEDLVKNTIKLNLDNANKFKQIAFYGFAEPHFFFNYQQQNGINPHTVILDYDFGTSNGVDSIPSLLNLSLLENLFFLSANAPVQQILDEINDLISTNNLNADKKVTIDVFEKSVYQEIDTKTQENLIEEYNKSFFEHSEVIIHLSEKYTFHPSSFIPIPEDIWMLESIIGSKDFIDKFKQFDNIISHTTIESVVNSSQFFFYQSKNKKRIYSENGLSYAKYFNEYEDLEKIKPIHAIKSFELFQLEQAVEKCYTNISRDEN